MIRDTYNYFLRDLKKWLNGRIYIVAALVMPAAWLIFVGVPLRAQFADDYLDFITPGIMVMTILFSSFQGGGLLVFDKIMGFMNKFLALPSSRESILLGKVSFVTFRGLLQATIILLIAVLLGVRVPGPVQVIMIYVALGLFSILFTAVAMTIALAVSDHDRYATVNSILSMPLFFASTALMPYEEMPRWLQILASLNPVSYAIDATRSLFYGGIPVAGILELLTVALIVTGVSMHFFKKATI
jgi:ABC-type multidrug transport system, permease component